MADSEEPIVPIGSVRLAPELRQWEVWARAALELPRLMVEAGIDPATELARIRRRLVDQRETAGLRRLTPAPGSLRVTEIQAALAKDHRRERE